MAIKKANINRLKALINKRSPTRPQQEKVLTKYEARQIANFLTAENLMLKLQSTNKNVVAKALKELEKYEDAQSVTGRINRQIEEKKVRLNTKTSMVDKLNKEQELEDEQNQPNVRARTKT